MRKLIVAVDLGTTNIVCAVGEKSSSGIKIISLSQAPSNGIIRGNVINIQQVLDVLSPMITETQNNIQETIKEIFIGIAGQFISCVTNTEKTTRSNPTELISAKEIEDISNRMYQSSHKTDEQVIFVVPQSFNIDDNMGMTTPIGMFGKTINANYKLFLGKRNSVLYATDVIKRSGLKVKGQIFKHIASAKAVLHEDECELGVAVLDIGGGTSNLLIIQNNIVRHAAVIPFGGNSITQDIRTCCSISLKQAEQLKIDYGTCYSEHAPEGRTIIIPSITGTEEKELSSRYLAEIIEARATEILEAAAYEIDLSGYKNTLKAGLVITGGSAQLGSICKLASIVTELDARIGHPINVDIKEPIADIENPQLSCVIGLVLKGYEMLESAGGIYATTTPFNIIPTKPKKEELLDSPAEENKSKEKNKGAKFGGLLKGLFTTDTTDDEDKDKA